MGAKKKYFFKTRGAVVKFLPYDREALWFDSRAVYTIFLNFFKLPENLGFGVLTDGEFNGDLNF
jgi:hypothetical protein